MKNINLVIILFCLILSAKSQSLTFDVNLTEVENFKFTLGKLLRKAKYTDSYVKMLLFKNDM